MTGYVRTDPLEGQYRRLLSWYPARHRAMYGEEMIGVLMSGAEPGQRRPGPREMVDLIVAGLRLRLRLSGGTDLSPSARSAAGLFGLLASVLLATLSWYEVVAAAAWQDSLGRPYHSGLMERLPRTAALAAVGWTLVALAAGYGLRRVAALGATLGVLGLATVAGWHYAAAPDAFVGSWWRLVLSATATACLAALARPGPVGGQARVAAEPAAGAPAPRPLGWRAAAVLGLAAMLVSAYPAIDRATTVITPVDGGWTEHSRLPSLPVPLPFPNRGLGWIAGLALICVLAVVVLRLTPTVRRRVLLFTVPAATSGVLVSAALGGFLVSSPRFTPPVYLTVGQWVALALTPILAFAVGVWMLRRYERRLASGALLA